MNEDTVVCIHRRLCFSVQHDDWMVRKQIVAHKRDQASDINVHFVCRASGYFVIIDDNSHFGPRSISLLVCIVNALDEPGILGIK